MYLHEQRCIDQNRPHRWPETRTRVRERDPAETRDQVEFLTAQAEQLLGGDRLDLVIATVVHGERLRQYVDREHPEPGPSGPVPVG